MAIGYGIAQPKPVTRKTVKARKTRAESTVKKSVRRLCFDRDGSCRIGTWLAGRKDNPLGVDLARCAWPGEWAHMHAKRRSQTRGQAPEFRHDTAHSLMLCRFHHTEYDQHRLLITALSRHGADGPLKFRRAKS